MHRTALADKAGPKSTKDTCNVDQRAMKALNRIPVVRSWLIIFDKRYCFGHLVRAAVKHSGATNGADGVQEMPMEACRPRGIGSWLRLVLRRPLRLTRSEKRSSGPAGLIVAVRSAITVPAAKAPTTASAMALRLSVFTCIDFS
jgi:hypothetical protein